MLARRNLGATLALHNGLVVLYLDADGGEEHVGLTSVVNFVESDEVEKDFRRNMDDVGDKVLEERIRLRRETLDNFAARNDVVCETMRLGQEE